MKKIMNLAAVAICLSIFSSIGFADSNLGTAYCRAAAMQSGYGIDNARAACTNIKSEGEGLCRAAAIKSGYGIDNSRSACIDVKSEAEGICRAGAIQSGYGIENSRNACSDL